MNFPPRRRRSPLLAAPSPHWHRSLQGLLLLRRRRLGQCMRVHQTTPSQRAISSTRPNSAHHPLVTHNLPEQLIGASALPSGARRRIPRYSDLVVGCGACQSSRERPPPWPRPPLLLLWPGHWEVRGGYGGGEGRRRKRA